MRLGALSEGIVLRLAELRKQCDAPYPFKDGGRGTIGFYAVEDVPAYQDIGAVHTRAEDAINGATPCTSACWASLGGTAARVEAAVGLPPLPEWSPDPDGPDS